MTQADTEQRQLARVQQRLERWRQQHGGPGRPIPDAFWAEAVALAQVFGAGVTARVLRLDRERVQRRLGLGAPRAGVHNEAPDGFVEVDTRRLSVSGQTVLRFERPDGRRLQIEFSAEPPVDIVALATAFWDGG